MNNKVTVANPKRKWVKWLAFYVALLTVLAIVLLLVMRTINTRNYNGQVFEVTGVVVDVNYNRDDGIEISLDEGKVYNANPVATFDKSLDLNALIGQTVTFYVPQSQFGSGLPWIIGIKQGDTTIVDYKELIASNSAENRTVMIIVGVIAGLLAVAMCGIFLWQTRLAPTTEKDLYKVFCEISAQRQPSSPDFKKFNVYVLSYIAYTMLICIVIAILGSLVENDTILIAVCVPLCAIFAAFTAGMFVMLNWVIKQERKYYAENFPFDFTDLTNVTLRKGIKANLQAELKAERARYPHRYGDGANGYIVEFCDMGLKFYNYDPSNNYNSEAYPSSEEVFGIADSEQDTRNVICLLSYEMLNFEAVPYYRNRERSLSVVIKSRLANADELPKEMEHDVHILLDSNLLSTLRQFNVQVENLQYILDNKAQLIAENCPKAKTNIK